MGQGLSRRRRVDSGPVSVRAVLRTMIGSRNTPPDLDQRKVLRSLLRANPDWVVGSPDPMVDMQRADRLLLAAGVYDKSRKHRMELVWGLMDRVNPVTPVLVRLCADALLDPDVNSPGAVLRQRMERLRAGKDPITHNRREWTAKMLLEAL